MRLYLADGYTPCSANDLTNTPAEEAPYQAMSRRVSHQVAKKKLHRYSVQQLRRMNQSHQDPGQRQDRRPARRGGEYLHLPLVRPVREPVPEDPGTGCVCGQP